MMDDSHFLILGGNGQLGQALQAQYPNARSTDVHELDITSVESLDKFDWSNIKIILNAAAYTNVDGAETPEGRVNAWKINATAVGNLVKIAQKHDLTLVHISTEYVFDGTKTPHKEDEFLSPLGVYAQTKAAAEIIAALAPKHYICRTSWLIGEGNNFVRTVLGLAEKNVSPTVVSDQVGRLTFTPVLVSAIDHLLKNNSEFGLYNVSNDGDVVSWADVTRAIFKELGRDDLVVTDTSTQEYYASKPDSSPRPLNSAFDLSKIKNAGVNLPDWREDLSGYVKKETQK